MVVRLIAGRAGSGKTHWCLTRICEELAASLVEGPRLILLVPEQAGLQMERGLLAMSGARMLGRCEVLSFKRLAHRILSEAAGQAPAVMSPNGRQMALRYLIGRHRAELTEFGRVAERAGFVAGISASMTELLQEAATVEQLEAAAARAAEEKHPSAARLHDVALLYRAYLEYLGSQRVDPEGVLDLARARLGSASWLDGAKIWIDGFAGLTQQQIRMTVELARRAVEVNFALLMEPGPRAQEDAGDEFSLFARTQQTWATVVRELREANVVIEEPVVLGMDRRPRFERCALLARLERDVFQTAKVGEQAPVGPPLSWGDEERPAVRFVKAADRRGEVAAAIRAVVDLVQSQKLAMRYRDVAVVVRDLEPYHDLISAELAAHGIPFFIDRRRPTYHHPLVQLVRAALMMQSDGRFDEAVRLLLKTGLVELPDEAADELENYLIAHGLATAQAWEEAWTYPPPGYDVKDAESVALKHGLERIDSWRLRFRALLGEWWPTEASKKGRPTCRTWATRLWELLDRLGTPRRVQAWCEQATARGELDEAEEHQQVWTDLMSLLEEMAEILGDEAMTIWQFRECLESGLSQLTSGLVPATLDQVLVSSIERSRHPPVRAVFVLGFADGQFPARIAEDSILSDEERQRLENSGVRVGRTRAARLLDERMLAYIAATRPSEFLWISYPQSDERGRPVSPSPYWAALHAALPELTVEEAESQGPATLGTASHLAAELAARGRAWAEGTSDNDSWMALYEWARQGDAVRPTVAAALRALAADGEAKLSPGAAAVLWREPYRTSVSALEQFAWCPFQHYAARGLKLSPRVQHGIAPVDLGRLYHLVMEQFVNEMIESGATLAEMSADEIAASVERICRLAVPKYAETVRMEQRQRRAALWRGRLDLGPAMRGAKSSVGRTKLRPLMAERVFGMGETDSLPALELRTASGKKILVRGRIDRVDIVPAGSAAVGVVFDYKRTVGLKLSLDEVYHGLALQLAAYLIVLREHGRTKDGARIVPGGAFYLPLLVGLQRVDDPKEATEGSFEPYKDYRPRGVVDFDALGQIDPQWIEGANRSFAAYRNKEGGLGYTDRSDAVEKGQLPLILDFVRDRMIELAAQWIDGEISVAPARLGRELPCTNCLHRGVCRFEYSGRQMRRLSTLGRTEVLNRMTGERKVDG